MSISTKKFLTNLIGLKRSFRCGIFILFYFEYKLQQGSVTVHNQIFFPNDTIENLTMNKSSFSCYLTSLSLIQLSIRRKSIHLPSFSIPNVIGIRNFSLHLIYFILCFTIDSRLFVLKERVEFSVSSFAVLCVQRRLIISLHDDCVSKLKL